MSDVILYDYARSSAAYRVRIALNLAGIAYRRIPVDLTRAEHKSPEHLARNPQGLVPVLDIDGIRLTQSLSIIEYLAEVRGLKALPGDAETRARIRAAAMIIAIDIHPVCNLSVANRACRGADDQDAAKRQWMTEGITPGLAAFEDLLGAFEQTPYCCGNTPTLADICLIPQLYNADRWGIDTTALSRIQAARNACARHPAFTAAAPKAESP